MIGSDALGSVLGAAPVGDPEHVTQITRAMIRVGLSPILMKPGTKHPICILSTAAAKKADTAAQLAYAEQFPDRKINTIRHDCGLKHVLDDPAKVSAIVKRAQEVYGPNLNIGIHLGRSRLLVVDVDTAEERESFWRGWADETVRHNGGPVSDGSYMCPPITVESPGAQDETGAWIHKDGGHWYFTVPDDYVFPPGKVFKGPGGWAAMWGESYVLAPPSVRPEGPYRLTGTPTPAPAWLLDMISSQPAPGPVSEFELTQDHAGNPIEQWSAQTDWHTLLTADGWEHSGTNTDCGCPNYRAPGGHASPKSATAHGVGCPKYNTRTGWAPLKIWTDHPPAGLPPEGAVTKFDYVARTRGLDTSATKRAIGVPDWAPTAGLILDPKAMAGMAEPPPGELVIRSADQIVMRTTRWSWEVADQAKWLPQGALSLLGGREGIGKSTLAYWIAAHTTKGTLPGDNLGRPRSVIIAAGEDDWEQTIVPRLVAAGADLTRCLQVQVRVSDDILKGLSLPADVARVKALCATHDVGLILLDPLLGSIPRKFDTHKDAEVREALSPVSDLAHQARVTVIGLIHQNKSSQGDLLTKLMGSRAFSAVARAVLVCAREENPVPIDGDREEPFFLFGQLKSNLGPKAQTTLRYRIVSKKVGTDPELGDPIISSRIEWVGEIDANIEQVLEQTQHRARKADTPAGTVTAWLLTYLAENGPSSRKELKDRAAAAGHAPATFDRAISAGVAEEPSLFHRHQDGRVVIYSLPSTDLHQVPGTGDSD